MYKVGSNEYNRIHYKIRTTRGCASEHNCVDCGNIAINWAWIHDTDVEDIDNYDPMCKPCHHKYDEVNFAEKHYNAKLTEQDVFEIRALHARGFRNKELSDMFGISQSHMSGIIWRRYWSHI